MAEQIVNEFTVNRPIDEAWPIICDVERIAPCLPGAQLEEIEGDIYRGNVKVKLGAVSTKFKGEAHFVERDDANHTAMLKAKGRDTGGRGNAEADIHATAESLSPTSTKCIVTADLHITGKVAQFGRGIMGDVSRKLIDQFSHNLNTMLDEQGPEPPSRVDRNRAHSRRARCRHDRRDRPSGGRRAADGPQDRGPSCRTGRSGRHGRPGPAQAARPGNRCDLADPVAASPPQVSNEPGDRTRVRELLGREPQGQYEIVVRDEHGDPVVLRNAPLLDDGTPMPTRYWLIGPSEIRRVGQLEADGGVNAAEAEIPPDELAAAHARYAAERDAAIPAEHSGPRPSGGVGGTRVGVKCLHAHWAWHLAGGDDPVGRWIASRLEPTDRVTAVTIGDHDTVIRHGNDVVGAIPWGAVNLTQRWLVDTDPPRPDALTNALGAVTDHLDDIVRQHPGSARCRLADVVRLTGRITGSCRDRPRRRLRIDRPHAPSGGRDLPDRRHRAHARSRLQSRTTVIRRGDDRRVLQHRAGVDASPPPRSSDPPGRATEPEQHGPPPVLPAAPPADSATLRIAGDAATAGPLRLLGLARGSGPQRGLARAVGTDSPAIDARRVA